MKKLIVDFEQCSVIPLNDPSLVSSMCLSIFCMTDGAMAQSPSAAISDGRFPADGQAVGKRDRAGGHARVARPPGPETF